MRIFWVNRKVTNDGGGDAVFDRNIVRELRRRHEVHTLSVAKNPLRRRLRRMISPVLPPDRAGFGTSADVARLASVVASREFDAVVISHEHLDYMAAGIAGVATRTGTPTFVINHNVTSAAMKSILGGRRGEVAGSYFRAYERRALTPDKVKGLFVLSVDDQRLLGQITGRRDVAVVLPGAPPARDLAGSAGIARDVVLLGSYDWFPKRWSLRRFADEWKVLSPPPARLYADDGVPTPIREELGALPATEIDLSESIRFGILTDRFKAGHKLKTAAYLMSNCVVLSFVDVAEDFRFSAHADLFIRRLSRLDQVAAIINEFQAMPTSCVRQRLVELKGDIATHMSWSAQAETLSNTLIGRVRRVRV